MGWNGTEQQRNGYGLYYGGLSSGKIRSQESEGDILTVDFLTESSKSS